MRILVVSNFYPPHFIGGYELGCFEATEALRARGHDIAVLTSTYKLPGPSVDRHVHRVLNAHSDFSGEWSYTPISFAYAHSVIKREVANQSAFLNLVTHFKPEAVYFWNPGFTSLSVLACAQRLGIPTASYIFDTWIEKWEHHDQWCRLWDKHWGVLGRLAGCYVACSAVLYGLMKPPFTCDVTSIQFASAFLQRAALAAGRPVAHGSPLLWGVHVERYPYRRAPAYPRHILFVGQLGAHKGVHTLIEAVRKLVVDLDYTDVRLSIAGGSVLTEYERKLRAKVEDDGLQAHVKFLGFHPREAMAQIYADHDILVFPSEWDEPFGITILEAMASGLAIVSSATGGSSEITTHEVDALHFDRGDADSCMRQIRRLLDDSETFHQLRLQGRRTVESRFVFSRTVDEIESELMKLA